MDNDVFISYSHRDKEWLERLQIALMPLIRNKTITLWDDTKIRPGKQWKQEIEKALNEAEVAVLLVSPNFLASDFIADKEVPHLLEAASQKGLTIIWVPVSYCMYEETEIANYQATHDPQRPLDSMSKWEQDKALVDVCKEIKRALEPPPEPAAPAPGPQPAKKRVAPVQTPQAPPSQPHTAQFGGTWHSMDGSYSVVQQNGNIILAEMFMNVYGLTTKIAWGQGMVSGKQAVLDFVDIYGNSGRSDIIMSDDGTTMTGVARYSNGMASTIFATRSL